MKPAPPRAVRPSRSRYVEFLRHLSGGGWLLVLWGALSLALLLDMSPDQRLAAGMVSRESIRAPARLTYSSEVRTEREREEAAKNVEPSFSPPDRARAISQSSAAESMARFLDAVRADDTSEAEKVATIAALEPVRFDAEAIQVILELPAGEWREVVDETLRLVEMQMRGEIRESRLPLILRTLPSQVSPDLSEEQARVVATWAGGLLAPNSFLDEVRTEQTRQAARDAVTPVQWTYEAGQIIVREGEIVSAEQVEALRYFGLQEPDSSPTKRLATILFVLMLVLVLGLYLGRVHPDQYENPRVMGLLVILLSGLGLGARLVMPDHPLLAYLLPTSAAAMLLGVLLGVDIAIIVTITLSLLVGYLSNSIEFISLTFVGGLMAALVLWRVERLWAFFWTGLLVGLTNVSLVMLFALRDGMPPWAELASIVGLALLNGMASASLALAGFYVLSSVLGITTFLQLMELARPTHPLFRELLLTAPGTYHHSIIVSNLAEAAAEAVGADMLLVRVAAYYHDVGKVKNPLFFIENQADGVNQHELIDDPYKSAKLILNHVSDGVRLAQRHKLPRKLIDFIPQHHGTTAVTWFYHRACERDGAEQVDVARFRYPGPKPQSREAAILMLADTVEAAARAVKPAGAAEIDALIRKMITSKLSEGQFDECELNLRDIETIRRAFLNVLQGIYHPRISYPEGRRTMSPAALPTPQEESHDRLDPLSNPDRPAVGSPR